MTAAIYLLKNLQIKSKRLKRKDGECMKGRPMKVIRKGKDGIDTVECGECGLFYQDERKGYEKLGHECSHCGYSPKERNGE